MATHPLTDCMLDRLAAALAESTVTELEADWRDAEETAMMRAALNTALYQVLSHPIDDECTTYVVTEPGCVACQTG